MRTLSVLLIVFSANALPGLGSAHADSRGDDLARWIDQRGRDVWGPFPEPCDDLTFARRLYLDVLGRVPSVSEIRDYQELGDNRRDALIDRLVFGEGARANTYRRLAADNLASHWRRVLIPPGTTVNGSPRTIEVWLSTAFSDHVPYDEMMRTLAQVSTPDAAGQYYRLLGSLPENYASHLSRVTLGVRMECAQCHEHPFVDFGQDDFWGLAAFYGDLTRGGDDPDSSTDTKTDGAIEYEGVVYPAKLLWSDEPMKGQEPGMRARLADWLTSPENPHFSATAVNRFWQHLVGRGLYADVENLDQATPEQRAFLDELGQRFAKDHFDVQRLTAAIAKSRWYQAVSTENDFDPKTFNRSHKVLSPEQVFDSLEQALMLPVSRIDPTSPRWSGEMSQLVTRLSETVGATPEEYAAGIPQALMLMNGTVTSDAVDLEQSRLLRAVVDSPFFGDHDRIETLYLAVLTRQPTAEEADTLSAYIAEKPTEAAQRRAFGEVLWALLNSPEFVLCR